jgi:PAS domain S-box-containing protein
VREGILLIDKDAFIQYANRSAGRLLGRTSEELAGSPLSVIGVSVEALPVALPDALAEAADGASELHLTDATGRRRTIVVTTSAVNMHQRALIICILHDVTELRGLEREVLALASRERDQHSGEVHEGIAQDLAGIALFLTGLVSNTSTDPAELEFVVEHINRVIARSRALARGLAPVQVAGGSLAIALERLAADITAAQNFRIVCKFNADEQRLSTTQADQLYRIAEQCLRITAQHANCREAEMELRSSGDEIELTIINDAEDNAKPCEEIKRAWERIDYLARVMGGSVRSTECRPGNRTRTTISLSPDALNAYDFQEASSPRA